MANQLLTLNGLSVQYDANGNLRDDGERSYSYDALDRLIAVTQGSSSTTFGYNGQGDRIQQTVDGLATTFALDLASTLPQVLTQQTAGATTYLLPGVGQQVNGAWQYLHADALGSVRLLSDPTGQVLSSMRYTPFGVLEAASGPDSVFGFTGEPSDPSGDLLYLRARFYHPALGRFLTPDSLIPDPLNGQDWNRSTYVRNDPLNLVDPSGHVPAAAVVRVLAPVAVAAGVALTVTIFDANMANNHSWWTQPPCDCQPNELDYANKVAKWLALDVGAAGAAAFKLSDEAKPGLLASKDMLLPLARGGVTALGAFLSVIDQGMENSRKCLSPSEQLRSLTAAAALGIGFTGLGMLLGIAAGPVLGFTLAAGASAWVWHSGIDDWIVDRATGKPW
ncbi:MAG: RHS repeat-associated core domain-containing protein [Blastochloris sp.]|nr:RHS repeat-associated core domain-containing protein [Blastochloris sp.]